MTRNAANATGLGSLLLAALCALAAAWVFHAGPRQSGGLYAGGVHTVASAQR